jgi:hypothetical protein
VEGWTDIADTLPFPLLGIDSDNGGEFINKDLIAWCKGRTVQFTRSRPYKKNDNCHVEQKNNACVREYVGYYRFTTVDERDALAAGYRALCADIFNVQKSFPMGLPLVEKLQKNDYRN